MKRRALLIAAELALVLGGCSAHHADPNADASPTAAASAPMSQGDASSTIPSVTSPTITATEHPFEAYASVDSDHLAWLALYYAVSHAAVDYAAAADQLDSTYQQTSDAFAKRDALNAFKPRLDAAIAQAKANPYRRLPAFQSTLPGYDLEHQTYDLRPIIGPDNRLDVASGEAVIAFAPSTSLQTYHPATEAEARKTEQVLGSNSLGRRVKVTVLAKAVAATLQGRPLITFAPARVEFENYAVDGTATPLFTASVP